MDLTTFRKEFPITKTHCFFNHAAVSPESNSTILKVTEYLTDAQYGDTREKKWIDYIEVVRKYAANLINASVDEIAFVNNVSTGAMLVGNGLKWVNDDNIIVPANQFPANVYPWLNLRNKGLIVKTPVLPRDESAYDTLFSHVDSNTRLIAISFVEYDDGFRYDLRRIGEFCRDRNIYLFVDAVQGLGAMELDVLESLVDFLAVSGHKWLLGPVGQGFLYVRQQLFSQLYISSISWLSVDNPWDFHNYEQPLKETARVFEGGTPNLMGIAALGAALELLSRAGMSSVQKRIFALSNYLSDNLLQKGYRIVTNLEPGCRSGITAFEHEHYATEDVYKALTENQIIVSQRNGRIRVSPHFYNTEEEIDKLIEVLPD